MEETEAASPTEEFTRPKPSSLLPELLKFEVSNLGAFTSATKNEGLSHQATGTSFRDFRNDPIDVEVEPEHRYFKIIDSSSNIVQIKSANKRRIVNLKAPDTGPKIHDIQPPYATEAFDPWKLTEACAGVPIVGFVSSKSELEKEQRKKIREFIGDQLNDEQFERLEMYCSPENLQVGNEVKITTNAKDIIFDNFDVTKYGGGKDVSNEEENLMTLKKYKLRTSVDELNNYPRKLKYRGLRMAPLRNMFPSGLRQENALVPGQDLLYRIRINRPFEYKPRTSTRMNKGSLSRCPIFLRDLVLPGRLPLWALRDQLSCINDANLRVDVSARPHHDLPLTCKDLFPSSFLFINNVFYNDQRQNCGDLSAPLIEWARKTGLGEFTAKDMAMRLDQITLKLGHPDVFVHQGDCEHTFSFSEVRLVSASDPLDPGQYPCHTLTSKGHTAYCTTCAEHAAAWLVTDADRLPFDPAFLCNTCFDLYLYDKDGNKMTDFKAYRFVSTDMQ